MSRPIYSLILCALLIQNVLASHHLRIQPDHCFLPPELQPLDQILPCYIIQPEKSFRKELSEPAKITDKNVTLHKINMTSLKWDIAEQNGVDHPEWKHRVEIYIPEAVKHSTALLYINGGTLYPTPKPPEPDNPEIDFAYIAKTTNSVVINLKDVPNQPLSFNNKPLREDALIAYSWERFLENPEKNRLWPLRLPMVKSAITAMSMVQEFVEGQKFNINNFVVAGSSKRGWTAWLVAALDKRVSAVIPMVIDILNLQKSMHHHKKAYGDWARAVVNYKHLMPLLDSSGMDQLLKIVEPYNYMEHLNIPKYIINASSDDFFLPDSSQFYYQNLPGKKWMRVLPNLTHYIVRSAPKMITNEITSFYGPIISKKTLPTLEWSVTGKTLKLTTSHPPKSIAVWKNHNPVARDFRLNPKDNSNASLYRKTEITTQCLKVCTHQIAMENPDYGWNAYFVEVIFANQPFPDFTTTTNVFIFPDTYPNQ